MTRDELIERFVKNRTKQTALTWGQFVSTVSASTPDEKAQILIALNNGDKDALCAILIGMAKTKKRELAISEVNTIIADNSVTVDELLTLVD